MKRKMLISIALITIMLLNCMMPLLVVNAATGGEITLNRKLYLAITKDLKKQGISFQGKDTTHTLTMSESAISSVTKLDLNEGGISDLTGLEIFTNLEHLELSGNNLTKNSNLDVLNSLTNLKYLDLSTNRLEDVSSISDIISRLKDNGTIILSSQTVELVDVAIVDTEEESNNELTASYELPKILEYAGFLKAVWKNISCIPQSIGTAPSIYSMPMTVTNTDSKIKIQISSETGAPYLGLVSLCIYIYDDPTEAAQANNPNKASENLLNGSRFYLYYVVHADYQEAITTMDANLYKAIKAQLTGGQKINPDLASYPYAVDIKGNAIYEDFYYDTKKIGGKDYQVLTNNETRAIQYALDKTTNYLYKYDGSVLGARVETSVEPTELTYVDASGNITKKSGYRVAYVTDKTGKTLYEAAYDAARTFVIDDTVLANQITSLILNNKQIRDLSGLEKFIGIESYINVSHNYLENIKSLYNMGTQKDAVQSQIQAKYTKWLNTREYGNLSKASEILVNNKKEAEGKIEAIEDAGIRIINILKSAVTLDKTSEKYNEELSEKAKSILEIIKEINGYTNEKGEKVKGSLELLDEALAKTQNDISEVYSYLGVLYSIYNKEHRLTTLLTDELNYLTFDEYQTYYEATHSTKDNAKALLTSEISKLTELEANNGLSPLDKELFTAAFGINFNDKEKKTPLADYFKEYTENTALNRVQILAELETIREISLYSEMSNYCLIKRMNQETATGVCYEKEFIEKKIKEFGYDDIPSNIEEKILERLESETVATGLHKAYKDYQDKSLVYLSKAGGNLAILTCKGDYQKVTTLSKKITLYTKNELVAAAIEGVETANVDAVNSILEKVGTTASANIIKKVKIHEDVKKGITDYVSPTEDLFLYNQMMSLTTKLLKGNVSRYVTLPDLKSLDISYNADLYDLSGITALSKLSEIFADYDYIADIVNVDWASMTALKKLSLGYNFISDISALTNLTNLKYLNLSNNLIAGELKITENQYLNLFKRLKELDLSGNQITDITSLLLYLDYITGGDYANYLAREDTLNINLNNQNIELEVKDPILLSEYPTTVDIELPKIFTQLLAIDTERTAFGETSQNGRIESEGTYVTLNTRTEGLKEGKVVVIPMSGDGTEVDTCIGKGTKATILYEVAKGREANVKISPSENVEVKLGETQSFTAEVTGTDDKTVEWKVEGNSSKNTTITEEGLLSIGTDETANKVTVVATSKENKAVRDSVNVRVLKNSTPDPKPDDKNKNIRVTLIPSENVEVKVGERKTFIATISGENITDRGLIWSVAEKTSENTTITSNGVLTVGNDEKADTIKVGVRSKVDSNAKAEVTVKVIKNINIPIASIELGYDTEEDLITGVKPETPINVFKTILLNDPNYVVVVKKGTQVVTSGYVATGMYVQIEDTEGNIVKDENNHPLVYQTAVTGDVNRDGSANSQDSLLIKAYRNEVQGSQLLEDASEAADINKDGQIDVLDTKLLLYHRAEVQGYNLNYR